MNALGMVEVFGFTTSIVCADIAAKSADVKIIALDKNKPLNGDNAEVPLIMCVKIEGSVAAVKAAVEAAKEYAVSKKLYVTSHIIPRPADGTDKLGMLSDVGRDRWIDRENYVTPEEQKNYPDAAQTFKNDIRKKASDDEPKAEAKNEQPKKDEQPVQLEVKTDVPQKPKSNRGRKPKK